MLKSIRLGTRKSKLALVQAEMVAMQLRAMYREAEIVVVPISTPGDTDKPRHCQSLVEKGFLFQRWKQH